MKYPLARIVTEEHIRELEQADEDATQAELEAEREWCAKRRRV